MKGENVIYVIIWDQMVHFSHSGNGWETEAEMMGEKNEEILNGMRFKMEAH